MTRTNLGGRPPYAWTETQIKEIKKLRAQGLGVKNIAKVMGVNSRTLSKKLVQIGPIQRNVVLLTMPTKKEPSWDEKVFESWSDRKARLARERAA